jgi:hypothetical protein
LSAQIVSHNRLLQEQRNVKNQFQEPMLYDHKIVDEKGTKIGEIRVTPSAIKWKAKSQQKYRSVTLQQFADWIESPQSKAKDAKR